MKALLIFSGVIASVICFGSSIHASTKLTLPSKKSFDCSSVVFHEPWVVFVKGHGYRLNDIERLRDSCEQQEVSSYNILINKFVVAFIYKDEQKFINYLNSLKNEIDYKFYYFLVCIYGEFELKMCESFDETVVLSLSNNSYTPALVYQIRLKVIANDCDANFAQELLDNPVKSSPEYSHLVVRAFYFNDCNIRGPIPEDRIWDHAVASIAGDRPEYFFALGSIIVRDPSKNEAFAWPLIDEAAARRDVDAIFLVARDRLDPGNAFFDIGMARAALCERGNSLGIRVFNSTNPPGSSC